MQIQRVDQDQEPSRMIDSSVKSLNQSSILSPILVWRYKMNKTMNKFFLAGDKFMPEMHFRLPGFMHSACEPFH